jgi:hyperosmotically inducible periplasmic protein
MEALSKELCKRHEEAAEGKRRIEEGRATWNGAGARVSSWASESDRVQTVSERNIFDTENTMKKRNGNATKTIARTSLLILLASLFPLGAEAQNTKQDLDRVRSRLAEEVRHQLVLLPYYGVFDNLAYEIKDIDTVILSGQVTRPTLKSEAENVVRKIEGVGKLENQIEVLPLSPNDDRIRIATYAAIYSRPGLDRYALRAVPPIHIIVKNGDVTLVGVVATEADKNLAGMMANGVSGVFKVTNDLRVEKAVS